MVPERSWRNALLPPESLLQDVIENLNRTSLQISLITSADGLLIGTITDGDIRRGLLRGLALDSPIDSVIHRSPLVMPPNLGRDAVINVMKANTIHQLPIVDADGRLVGLHVLHELMSENTRENALVIMAGGKGKRLQPHTETCPKPLLPVAGKPMLEHIVERARSDGFRRIFVSIHYLGEMIEDYFGDGSAWGVEIDYVREDRPLGTIGAVGLLDPVPELPFVVTNGDVLTDISYGELLDFHTRHDSAATMAVRLFEWQHPFGVVETDGMDIVGFQEKPVARSYVNAGIYVLAPSSLRHVPPNQSCDMPVLFQRLRDGGERTVVFPMHEPWLDIGRMEDYERANGG